MDKRRPDKWAEEERRKRKDRKEKTEERQKRKGERERPVQARVSPHLREEKSNRKADDPSGK